MDAPAAPKRYLLWLPYWAVLQTDLRQTGRNWVFRTWVTVTVMAGLGYFLYRFGMYRELRVVQESSAIVSDLLRWTVLGSITLVIIFAAGSIAAERGTLADSVLSRGISRYQYFLAKWHARMASVLGCYLAFALSLIVASHFLLHEDIAPDGCLIALAAVGSLLAAVVTCGVTVSALSHSTVFSISAVWSGLYGAGFLLALLPVKYPTPDRLLSTLPQIMKGTYDAVLLGQSVAVTLGLSLVIAILGMIGFSRSDV